MIEKVLEHIRQNKSRYIDLLSQYVTIPSIADDAASSRKCAESLKVMMESAGIETQIFETAGNPIVYGEIRTARKDAPTVLFYGHYDVQPVEPLDEWRSPPFEGTIREGRLFARGSADNKGQHLAHVLAINAYRQTGVEIPIHCKFIFEGEEEVGSEHLAGFVAAHRNMLEADVVYVSDGPMDESDVPAICFGNRGVCNFAIEVETARMDNHSGNKGGVIPDAGWELNGLLAGMLDRDGNVRIEGFYDDVKAPTEYEEELIKKLPYDTEKLAKVFGVEKLYLDKKTYYRNLCFRPTLTINALLCGNPATIKNIVPGKALAKLDVRLVANQDADKVFECIVRHVEASGVRGRVKVTKEGTDMYPSKTDPGLPICRDIVGAIEIAYGRPPVVLPVMGGSLPNAVWTDAGLPVISVPYANVDENNHAPNENMRLDCYMNGIMATARVLDCLRDKTYV